jgi:hypothetical protein
MDFSAERRSERSLLPHELVGNPVDHPHNTPGKVGCKEMLMPWGFHRSLSLIKLRFTLKVKYLGKVDVTMADVMIKLLRHVF